MVDILELREKYDEQYKNRPEELSKDQEAYWFDQLELNSLKADHAKRMLGRSAVMSLLIAGRIHEI